MTCNRVLWSISLPQVHLTKPRKPLNPELSNKPKGVTTQIKALDEYFLMAVLTLLQNRVHVFCANFSFWLFQLWKQNDMHSAKHNLQYALVWHSCLQVTHISKPVIHICKTPKLCFPTYFWHTQPAQRLLYLSVYITTDGCQWLLYSPGLDCTVCWNSSASTGTLCGYEVGSLLLLDVQ